MVLQLWSSLGERAKNARLHQNLTRKTLALYACVPESTIKRFENTGEIGTASMLSIATALDMCQHFDEIFKPAPFIDISEITRTKKFRGRK